MTTLHGTLLAPRSATECDLRPSTVVRINNDGVIAEVGAANTRATDVVGGEGCWLLPGFVDAHLHLPQWDRRGIDGLPFSQWMEQVIYPAEARMANVDLAERLAEQMVTGLIACGTTTAAVFSSPSLNATDRAFSVFARRGFRALCGMVLNDVNCPAELGAPADELLDRAKKLAATWHGRENGRLQYAFCPRTASSCSEKLLRGAATLADMMKCHIMTHVAESSAEESQVRERFPECLDDVEVFAQMGILGRRTLLGHGVCLNESMRHQVAESQTAVVHCPTANLFLEAGLMDYAAHRNAGIRIALGSSVAAGPEPFMPQVAVAGIQTAKALKVHAIPRGRQAVPTAAEGWWLLTAGAAEALDMGDCIGRIQPGFQADILVVRPEGWIAELPPDQQVSALLYTLRPEHIEHVFIAGRRVGPR